MVRRLIHADGVVLLAAAAAELAFALGAAHVGAEPGDAAPGAEIAGGAAYVAMLAGIVLALVGAARGLRSSAILSPAAGLFLTAFFYTEDPYHAPYRRRYSDGGAVATSAIYVVLAVCVIAGIVALRWPRVGGRLVAVALGVCWVTTLFAGDGH